jgi:hypothetical protein
MEMRDEHIDYAVVDRPRKMLVAPPATDFKISLSYALFCSIFFWVLQHVPVDKDLKAIRILSYDLAIEVAGTLKKERSSDHFWRWKWENTSILNKEQGNNLFVIGIPFESIIFILLKMLPDAKPTSAVRSGIG